MRQSCASYAHKTSAFFRWIQFFSRGRNSGRRIRRTIAHLEIMFTKTPVQSNNCSPLIYGKSENPGKSIMENTIGPNSGIYGKPGKPQQPRKRFRPTRACSDPSAPVPIEKSAIAMKICTCDCNENFRYSPTRDCNSKRGVNFLARKSASINLQLQFKNASTAPAQTSARDSLRRTENSP